eukprot:667702-Rhodomonas_salina.1
MAVCLQQLSLTLWFCRPATANVVAGSASSSTSASPSASFCSWQFSCHSQREASSVWNQP